MLRYILLKLTNLDLNNIYRTFNRCQICETDHQSFGLGYTLTFLGSASEILHFLRCILFWVFLANCNRLKWIYLQKWVKSWSHSICCLCLPYHSRAYSRIYQGPFVCNPRQHKVWSLICCVCKTKHVPSKHKTLYPYSKPLCLAHDFKVHYCTHLRIGMHDFPEYRHWASIWRESSIKQENQEDPF